MMFVIRLSDDEHALLKQRSVEVGVSMAQLVRDALFRPEIVLPPVPEKLIEKPKAAKKHFPSRPKPDLELLELKEKDSKPMSTYEKLMARRRSALLGNSQD